MANQTFLCARVANNAHSHGGISGRAGCQQPSMITLFTGLIAGVAHVWSGPDHLAAIAPLATRHRTRQWLPGLRWGIGHSGGVAVVGLLSLWLKDLLPVKLVSLWGERLVGLTLVAIGLWALRKA